MRRVEMFNTDVQPHMRFGTDDPAQTLSPRRRLDPANDVAESSAFEGAVAGEREVERYPVWLRLILILGGVGFSWMVIHAALALLAEGARR